MIKYLIEFIGTFIFVGVTLNVMNKKLDWAPLAIGLSLTAIILWGGGHFNPVISIISNLDTVNLFLEGIFY